MKKLLIFLIIPFLGFGQESFCLDESACNYTPEAPPYCLIDCQYPQDGCEAILVSSFPQPIMMYVAFWDDDCNCICEYDEDGDGVCDRNETTDINEALNPKLIINKIDILGRCANNTGFQLHVYDDGSVEKKYVIK